MNLANEIKALGVEIAEQACQRPKLQDDAQPVAEEATCVSEAPSQLHDAEAFLKAVNETLDEFADDLNRHPHLTALAALGIGHQTR
ncbi:hypothetical protein [Pseudomonas sp.]|uniref:hypothetical protein n=1 Tax=Pseudomonas sp. TaxID=306 RepID=UPI003D137610